MRMIALINDDQSKFVDVDSEHFLTALSMSQDEEPLEDTSQLTQFRVDDEPFLAVSAPDESTTLCLPHANKNCTRSPTKGIQSLTDHCDGICELSLSYALLSDELLKALSRNEALHLKTLRVEAHPDTKPSTSVSSEAWLTFSNRLPDVNFVLLTHLTEAQDYEALLTSHVPVTHVYFGECAPATAVARVGDSWPRLIELVVGAYGPDSIDETLVAAARGCPRLSAVGLGDCEVTCSGLVKFVSLCCERLQVLYVLDTSLLEDSEHDEMQATEKVSTLLGKSWQPNYVPYW